MGGGVEQAQALEEAVMEVVVRTFRPVFWFAIYAMTAAHRSHYFGTHLNIYLETPRLNRKANLNLDILSYWKEDQHLFGDLVSMALDILNIRITRVYYHLPLSSLVFIVQL
ncbi:hypothetical protein Bca4012_093660 [Brassica carinata]